jgi:ATP-dependent DNA helicase MPH1
MEETDGSDSGADLVGFIVGDDVLTSSIQQRSTVPTTPVSSDLSLRHGRKRQAPEDKPYYEPMEFGPTQETDDEMPDLAELVARNTPANKAAKPAKPRTTYLEEEDDTDESDELPRPSPRRPPAKRKRQVLADSDDDE